MFFAAMMAVGARGTALAEGRGWVKGRRGWRTCTCAVMLHCLWQQVAHRPARSCVSVTQALTAGSYITTREDVLQLQP